MAFLGPQELNRNLIEDGEALGQVAKHPRLTRLSLHGNWLNGTSGAELFRGVQGGVLSDLDLAWNQLDGDEAAKALAQLLRSSAACPKGLSPSSSELESPR